MSLIPDRDGSNVIAILVVCIIFWILAVIAVGLRIWSRSIKKTGLRVNDHAMFIALFLATCFNAMVMTSVLAGGVGQHVQNVDKAQIIVANKILVFTEPIWSASNSAVKISILHLYIEIFRQRFFRHLCYTMMGLTICFNTVVVFEAFLLCRPFAYNWNKSIDGSCADTKKAWVSAGIINFLIDFIIIHMPMPLLWKLQLPVMKKIGITVIFHIGALILAIKILRIVSIQRLDYSDLPYSLKNVVLWSVLELLLGVVNACSPTIRPAIQKLFSLELAGWSKFRKSTQETKIFDSNTSASHSTSPIAKNFHRLHEQGYNLGNIDVESHDTFPEDFNPKEPTVRVVAIPPPPNSIQVTRAWNIHSESAATSLK